MCVDDFRVQKRVRDLMELELPAIANCPIWVLGTKLSPSGRLENALNC